MNFKNRLFFVRKLAYTISITLILFRGMNVFASQTKNPGKWIAGFDFSFIPTEHPKNFVQYDLQGIYLRNMAHHKKSFSFLGGFGGFVGILNHLNENALVVHPMIQFGPAFYKETIMLILSTGPAYISKSQFDNNNFGGPIEFISSVGIRVHPVWKISIAYRFQHMSNANLYRINHMLNLQVLELNYHF